MEEAIGMHECETMTGVSTQEEADTLVIHHAVEVASSGMKDHIIHKTRMCCFWHYETTLLGDHSAAIIGTAFPGGLRRLHEAGPDAVEWLSKRSMKL